MKKVVLIFIAFLVPAYTFGISVKIPNFTLYAEMNNQFNFVTSYDFDMLFDTGLKYGVELQLGFNGYQVTTLSSNYITLSSLKSLIRPWEWFQFGFFMGDNRELGRNNVEYTGFQYHQRAGFSYLGYHTINGIGLELAATLWDRMFEPHLLIYSTPVGGTNYFNADALLLFATETLEVEAYLGINFDTALSLQKHFGVTLRTLNPRVNFLFSVYMPDSGFLSLPGADDLYVNFTEKLRTGAFEQVITLFMRPSEYNGREETVSYASFSDIDIYLRMGVIIKAFGIGVENTFTVADPASFGLPTTAGLLSDRAGAYTYFNLNNLLYKVGVHYSYGPYYSLTHTTDGGIGVFLSVQGEL